MIWQMQKKAVQQSQALLVVSQKLTSEVDLQTLLELMMDVLAELTRIFQISEYLRIAVSREWFIPAVK